VSGFESGDVTSDQKRSAIIAKQASIDLDLERIDRLTGSLDQSAAVSDALRVVKADRDQPRSEGAGAGSLIRPSNPNLITDLLASLAGLGSQSDPEAVDRLAATALSASFALNDASAEELDRALRAQLDEVANKERWIAATTTIAGLAVVYLLVAFYLAVMATV